MKKILILTICTVMLCSIGCGNKKSKQQESATNQESIESATVTADSKDSEDSVENIFTKAKAKAVQYEMNIIENGYKNYYWNAPLQYDESYTQEEVEPKGKYTYEALEKFFGVTRESVTNKVATGKTRNAAGDLEEKVITAEDKYIISEFLFEYFMSKDNTELYQICTAIGMDTTKEIVVTWKDGEVVNYEKIKN